MDHLDLVSSLLNGWPDLETDAQVTVNICTEKIPRGSVPISIF